MSASPKKLPRRQRDRRLDFFRGIAMFIILIAHIPNDWWALWIPARFGFSDGAEMFVFCSGMASALAFGSLYRSHGFGTLLARVSFRVWQIYWAHIMLFLATVAVLLVGNAVLDTGIDYTRRLWVVPFLENTELYLPALLTLTYVPGLFDMLPMYVAVLCLLPIVATLGSINRVYAGIFVVSLWLLSTTNTIDLPGSPVTDHVWFFNPFGWQLVFYTGFAFAMGWLKPPPIERKYVLITLAIVLISVPLAYYRIYNAVPELKELREALKPFWFKTDYGVFRYIHFLSLAYLSYAAVGEGGRRLFVEGILGRIVNIFRIVGQQSLAVFMASIVLAQILGMTFDVIGRNHWTMIVVNLFGFACLIAVAKVVTWYKSEPWRKVPEKKPDAGADNSRSGAARIPGYTAVQPAE